MGNKTFIILRGVSSCGKSSFARFLLNNLDNAYNCEADMFMMEGGQYVFKAEKLGYCHKACFDNIEVEMKVGTPIIILSNTSTREKELSPYLELARKYGYSVVSLVVEKRHNGEQQHNVPEETLAKQENNIKNSLKLR